VKQRLALALAALAAGCGGDAGTAGAPTGPVVISEIMYHPVLEDAATEDHEFVELYNRSGAPVALAGWKLAGGIRFTFPAGVTLAPKGFAVVAKNRARLAADVPAYGLRAADLLGDYEGALDNGGERLALTDSAGAIVDQVDYSDAPPWPVGADALGAGEDWMPPETLPLEQHRFMGRSLERVDASRPGSSPANWVASPLDGATPGRPNLAVGGKRPVIATISVNHGSPVRAGEMTGVRIAFAGDAPVAASIEYFIEDVERDDEPRMTAPFELGADGYEARLRPLRAGAIVRYRVLGDRGRGQEVLAPREGDPAPYLSFFVSVELPGNTPAYQLFLARADWTSLWDNIAPGRVPGNGNGTNPVACAVNDAWNGRVPAVFVAGGHVYDVSVRYEGSFQGRTGGATIDLKKWPPTADRPERPVPFRALSWSIKFPRYDRMDGKKSFILNKLTQSCQGFNTLVGNALFERAGIPAAQSRYARLYINGTYYHYMLRVEHMDDDFVKRALGKGDPGDLFKSVGGRWDEGPYGYSDERPLAEYCGYTTDQRYEASYERMTNTDWKSGGAEMRKLIEELAAARDGGLPAIRKFFEDNFAMDELTTYMAVINWMVAWDDQYHNHYLYRRPGDGRWMMLPTDMDNVMGGAPPSTFDASFFAGQWNVRSNRNDYWSYLKDAYLRAFRAELIARVSELDRTVLEPNAVSALIDELTDQYEPTEAAASPAGVSCGKAADAVMRLKDFAYARSARVAAGLFD
jgi:hypothetical protein